MTEAHQAFTQLLDRGLPAEGRLAAWCPTMDLLALVTADGQLHVHRLNWQRLWWTSPDTGITALEWRPDGKQLAVGLEDGTVMLLDTEDGEVQHKAQLLQGSLVAISWTEAAPEEAPAVAGAVAQQHGGGTAGTAPAPVAAAAAATSSQLSGDRTQCMFTPPPPPLLPASGGFAVGYATCGKRSIQAWPAEPARLAVLACASAAGHLVLCTSGLFPLASLQLPRLLGCPAVSVLRLATAPTLQQLTVCWCDSSSGSSAGNALRLTTIDMQHVGSHAAKLHRLAQAAAHVGALLEGCLQSFQAANKEWQASMHEFTDSSSKLAGLMGDYGTRGKPADELQALLATGAVGGALQQYITATLGEPGLKKLARALDAAVCSVHALLTDHLQPQLEQLVFRLGELRGLALCLPWRRVTGLQHEQVGAAEQAAVRLVVQAEAVRRRLVQAGAQYRTFFAWLLIVLRRMQEDAADALAGYPQSHLGCVADFLAGQYQWDAVGPMLGSISGGDRGDGGTPKAAVGGVGSASGVGSILDAVLEALGRQALVQAADSTASPSSGGCGGGVAVGSSSSDGISSGSSSSSGLGQLLLGLQTACSAAFDQTSAVISPSIAVLGSVTLGAPPSALAAAYLPGGARAAAVAWEGQQQVLLLRSAADSVAAAWEAAVLHLPERTTAVDVAFYKDGQLALLLSGGTCRLALLAQDQLQFVQLPGELLVGMDALQLCQQLLQSDTAAGSGRAQLPAGCRLRTLQYPCVQPPLAISASRGVGCLMAGTQRVVLYDLEEEEDEEDAEGAEAEFDEGASDGGSGGEGYESPN